jgi:hypothetical protein
MSRPPVLLVVATDQQTRGPVSAWMDRPVLSNLEVPDPRKGMTLGIPFLL